MVARIVWDDLVSVRIRVPRPLNIFLMATFFRKFTIPFFVFITGACVLIIEVIAIRILSPYFGNTIFTVSSVISVVLAALSLGYYVGGNLADRHPTEKLFYSLIALSGAATIFLYLAGSLFLYNFGYKLSIVEGPLLSSLMLFFLQNFFLGMLSPFAIKLQSVRLDHIGIGKISGQIFFWSTFGSIVGSLSAGFFLIPNFGIDKIMIGTGVTLVVLGLFGNLKVTAGLKSFLAIFLLATALFSISSVKISAKNVVYLKDSLYQKIMIYEGMHNGKPTRFLQQDRNSSSAEFINSDELAYEYTKYYILYQIFNPNIKNALMIGGGAYSVPKALLQDLPNVNIDVAEIDPLIFELGKTYFKVPGNNPQLNNVAKDGRRFLHDSHKKYDFIFSDAYASFFSTPEHLTTQEFFTLAKSKLSSRGVFIANVVGSLATKPQSFALSEMKTFKSVFQNSYFFAVNSSESPKPQNLIFVGYNGDNAIDFNGSDIKKNKNYIISGLSEKIIDVDNIDLSYYPILTDNFAPVDYLISKEF